MKDWQEYMEKSEEKIRELERKWVDTWNELRRHEEEGIDLMEELTEYYPEENWDDQFEMAAEERERVLRKWKSRLDELKRDIERYKRKRT